MLYLENEEIKITEDGMMFPEVKALYSTDRGPKGKHYFKKCLVYLYWAHKIDGEYSNHLPAKRKKLSAGMADMDYSKIKDNKYINAVAKLYVSLQETPSQKQLNSAIKRVEETIDWLDSIPIKKTIKQKIEVYVDVPGKEEKEKMMIPVEVEINNAKEVKEAVDLANKLTDQINMLRKKVVKEKLEKKSGNRLWD